MKLNPYPGIPATFHDSTQISPFQQTSTSKTKLHSTSLSNSCDTKASFTPANDTTVYTGQAISFTNTSQNADSFEWFNDINNRTTETDFTNFVPSVGVTQIMLVAHRNVCTDTAVTYIVNNGTPPADPKRMITSYGLPNLDESSVSVVQAKSDGYLLVGESTDENSIFFSYIIRVSETGCVLWSKRMPANVYAVPRSAISTYDSGFVLLESSLDSLEKNSFLCKFDDKGNIVWSRSYVGTVALSSAAEIRELSDHSLMVLSGEFGYDFFSITSMDETGIFRWQKRYLTNDAFGQNQTFFSDVVDRNGDAWLSGGYMQYNGPNEYDIFAILFKVDLATGNIMWSNAYHHPSKNYRFSGIHFYKDGLIMNGFIDSLEFPSQYETPYLETLVETDLDGNIRDSKSINFPAKLDAYAGDRLITHADNSMSLFYYGVEYRPTQEFPAEHSFLLRLDANKNIVWQNQYTGFTIGSNLNVAPAPFKGLAMLGRKLNNLSNPASGLSLNFVLVKVDSNGMGPGPHCDFYETFTKLQNLTINPTSLGPFAVSDFNLQTIEHPLTLINPNTEIRYNCPDYIPFCSFMKLSGKNSVCNLNDTVAFVAHKDPSCADPVKWTYDVSNIKTVYVDGNKALLTFAKPGVYKILAEKPFPCTAINDSMIVTVAGPIDLGAPRTKCKSDSLLITLPAGYQTYEWQPLYNIAMPFGQGQVIFFPRIDTVYHLTVTDAAGCRESADLPFHILPSADLNIGNDTAICTGGSVTFSAGTGFSSYAWSNGDSTSLTTVNTDGSYSVTVTDRNNCRLYDAVSLHVYPAPEVHITGGPVICKDQALMLDAGTDFISYRWQDGTQSHTLNITDSGYYKVQVTDQQGCSGSDSVRIEMIDCRELVIFPNVFSPNHDGLNDVFRVKYPGLITNYNLQIFNRWGQKMFETSDTSSGWDGTFNSQLQPGGTYVWIVRYTDHSANKKKLQGTVILIR